MLAKLQMAYPDGFESMDLWIGGLLEKPMAGQLGSTFGYIFLEQLHRLQHGDRLYYLEIFDDSLFRDEGNVTFADIIERNTGLTGLPENVFDLDGSNAPADDDEHILTNVDEEDDDTAGQDDDDDEDDDDTVGQDDDDEDDDDDTVGQDDDDDDEDDEDDDDEDDDDSDDDDDDDDDGAPAPGQTGHVVGTPQDDMLFGNSGGDLVFGFAGTDHIIAGGGADVVRAGSGNDFVDGGAGRDVLFGEDGDDDMFGGDDDDMVYGGAGDDRMFGGDGNDLLDAGDGDDAVFGGNGNDMIVASLNDGNDTYYGGDISGDTGTDTLDMGFLTVDAVVDLGTGVGGRGSAVSSQSGTDTLWGIENVVTGSGNDTIVMSNAVNIVDGGLGDDVFVFGSATAAHGDTIRGFETGDKIDLSGIDANTGTAGNDTFVLESGQATTAPGQIVVTHETREDGEYTVVVGNTSGDNAPEFRINIAGNHALTADDFNL
jgi:Ca2+-binding RTX toxin-like protein